MKRCVIFCAGGFDGLLAPIEADDLVIAADGGLAHVQALQIQPDVILGDFDSLGYVPESATVFPVEKDDTDAMLAVRHGLSVGCDKFLIYGGLEGPRLDHTLANFQTLQFLVDHGAEGSLIGKDSVVTVLSGGTMHFPAESDGILSVFCMGEDAAGVTIEGAKYPLKDGTLTAGFPLGVSNRFVGKPVAVRVERGSLLVLYPRQCGILWKTDF